MSYRYKSSRLVTPPPPPPLACGSVYSNPAYACADFSDAAGKNLSLTLKDFRAILVHKTMEYPDIPFEELRSAFRDAIRITPHTHSDINMDDVATAFNPIKSIQP